MANVLHRITKTWIESVNTPDYSVAEWIINPDLAAVEHLESRYWKIVGDSVLPMSSAESEAVDRQEPFLGMNLAESKALARLHVNNHRDAVMRGGWTYDGIRYDSDPQARQNMSGTMTLISTGYILPPAFTWRDANNMDHPFDNETFTSFFRASCIWMETLYQTSWAHKAQIDALTSAEAVQNYDITVGWPN